MNRDWYKAPLQGNSRSTHDYGNSGPSQPAQHLDDGLHHHRRYRVRGDDRGGGAVSGWQLFDSTPDQPCNVLLICAPFQWQDHNGNPVDTGDPMRDALERMELAFWDGEMWCEAGTGHDIVSDLRSPHLMPTHWMPLPPPPEA